MRRTLAILLAGAPLVSGTGIYLGCSSDAEDCLLVNTPCNSNAQAGSGGGGAGSSGSGSGSGGTMSQCGNGVANGAEECDGQDLAGKTSCTDLGYVNAGTLACDSVTCMFTGCDAACDNMTIEPGEDCEPPGSTDSSGFKCGADCAFVAIINEVLYDTTPPPISGPDMGCYIELKGPPGMSLNGHSLHFSAGGDGQPYTTPLILSAPLVIGTNGYFLIGQGSGLNPDPMNCFFIGDPRANMQNGPHNVLLLKQGAVVDALGYDFNMSGVFQGEGMPAVDANQNATPAESLSRSPDGTDTDNNFADFRSTPQTPCVPNL